MRKYDLIIIGAGPAGLSAGIYAARAGLKTGIISKDIGGTCNSILVLENWPGFEGSGAELIKRIYEQIKKYDVNFLMSEVENIEKEKSEFIIKIKSKNFSQKVQNFRTPKTEKFSRKEKIISESIIIATGTERKKLNIEGEKKFLGRGVSYCVTCDSFFFKNKIVGIVGGSDCAAVSALALSDIAKKVYVFIRGKKLKCEEINSKRLEKKKNVEIFYNSTPLKIKGENKIDSFVFKQEKEKEIKLDGIFVEIGAVPLTNFIKNLNLKLDKEKYIVVDEKMRTSVPGIFAAGDIINRELKQVIIASGDGAIAAKSAYEYINS